MITAERIKRFAPSARADLAEAIVKGWPEAEAAGITTPRRVRQFMAELATETGGLKAIEENLNYSAERLREVFPSRVSAADAKRLARKPREIANHVYGSRLGNRKGTDDGWNYRGSGFMQTTGRDNFAAAGQVIGIDLLSRPEILRTPGPGFSAAVAFWKAKRCNAAADTDDVAKVRKIVNGGTNGLDDARTYLAKARRVWPDSLADDLAPAPAPVPLPPRRPPQEPVQADEAAPAPAPAPAAPEPAPAPSPAPTEVPEPHPEPIAPPVTAKDLKAAGSRTITGAWSVKLKAWGGMIGGGLTAAVSGVGDFFGDTWDKLQPVRDVATNVPGWAWGGIAVVVSYLLWRAANKVEKARVADEAVLRTRS